jgi:hypothetical protein
MSNPAFQFYARRSLNNNNTTVTTTQTLFDSKGNSLIRYKNYTSQNSFFNVLLVFLLNGTIYTANVVTNDKNKEVSYIFSSIVGPNTDNLTRGSWFSLNIEGVEYGVVNFYT